MILFEALGVLSIISIVLFAYHKHVHNDRKTINNKGNDNTNSIR